MATDLDAYRVSDEARPSWRQRPSKPLRKRMLSILSVTFLVAVVIVVAVVLATQKDSDDDASAATKSDTSGSSTSSPTGKAPSSGGSTTGSSSKGACAARRPAPHTRTVAFWQSEVAGCEKIPSGVTHVVFGFALVDGATGRVIPTFQNTDAEILKCVQTLRKNCIATMGSIGGSTNNDAIANITDADAFAASAVALVKKFGFDGIDIDDETVGSAFNASRVVGFVEATRTALSKLDATLLLSYDGYFNEGEPSFCKNEANAAYSRCFPTQILQSVDWVNIMAYNVALDPSVAAGIYEKALNSTFMDWKTQLGGDFSKATIGVCVDKSCAYGPGPSSGVIASWNAFARVSNSGGGMMVYAASGEVAEDFAVTRSVLPRSS